MLQIRPYRITDKQTCLSAFASNIPLYFATHELALFDSFLTNFEKEDEAFLARMSYSVIELAGNVIGCGGFGFKEQDKTVTFAWGLVDQAFHKQGYGVMLLKYRLDLIKTMYPKAQVLVDTTQFSFSFFQKYGFRTTKITPDYYAKGYDRYDMVLV
jgi:[ribosomal protein S18]-alanine N-acetyltransferase